LFWRHTPDEDQELICYSGGRPRARVSDSTISSLKAGHDMSTSASSSCSTITPNTLFRVVIIDPSSSDSCTLYPVPMHIKTFSVRNETTRSCSLLVFDEDQMRFMMYYSHYHYSSSLLSLLIQHLVANHSSSSSSSSSPLLSIAVLIAFSSFGCNSRAVVKATVASPLLSCRR
jgi:hypothetical protein